MIGFVQDMDLHVIFDTVNDHLKTHGIPKLRLQGKWQESGITELDHDFERSFSKSPFLLIHRWLDIRDVPKTRV